MTQEEIRAKVSEFALLRALDAFVNDYTGTPEQAMDYIDRCGYNYLLYDPEECDEEGGETGVKEALGENKEPIGKVTPWEQLEYMSGRDLYNVILAHKCVIENGVMALLAEMGVMNQKEG